MLPLDDLVRHFRRQRRVLGLTQTALAQAAGTSQSLIAKLEQGRLNPSYETVRRVHDALQALQRKEEPVAQDLMQREPVSAGPHEPLHAVLARMKRHGYSQLPILDEGRPVGSMSEGALLHHLERGADLDDLKSRPVAEVMQPAFPSVQPDASRRLLVELLRENEAVLVLRAGRLAGVITKSDLW